VTTNASVSLQYSVAAVERIVATRAHDNASLERTAVARAAHRTIRGGAKPPEESLTAPADRLRYRVETTRRPLCAVIAHRCRSSHLTGGLRARQVSFNVFLMVYAVVSHARCVEFTPMVMCKPAVQTTVAGRVFDSFVSTGLWRSKNANSSLPENGRFT
jgi:hypothetical protein